MSECGGCRRRMALCCAPVVCRCGALVLLLLGSVVLRLAAAVKATCSAEDGVGIPTAYCAAMLAVGGCPA